MRHKPTNPSFPKTTDRERDLAARLTAAEQQCDDLRAEVDGLNALVDVSQRAAVTWKGGLDSMQKDRDSMAEELEAAQDKLAAIEGWMSERMGEAVVLTLVELTAPQALALAQFVKRCGWTEWRLNAVDDDEACLMRDAFNQLDRALADAGYAPR